MGLADMTWSCTTAHLVPSFCARAGVAEDSVRRFTGVLRGLGIPTFDGGTGDRQRDNASLLARVDWLHSQRVVGNLLASARQCVLLVHPCAPIPSAPGALRLRSPVQ